jgi:hypothetical protein
MHGTAMWDEDVSHDMAIPGYDLDDLDGDLQAKLDRQQLADYLTDDEQRQLREGAHLLDLLDDEDLDRLLAGEDREQ